MRHTLRPLVLALLTITALAAAPVAAQPDGPADGPSMPNLPEQASDTAKQVLNTIQSFFDGAIENLGRALQDLLGGGQAGGGESG